MLFSMFGMPGPMELLIILVILGLPAVAVFLALRQTWKSQAAFRRQQADLQRETIDAEIVTNEDDDQSAGLP